MPGLCLNIDFANKKAGPSWTGFFVGTPSTLPRQYPYRAGHSKKKSFLSRRSKITHTFFSFTDGIRGRKEIDRSIGYFLTASKA